MTWKVCTKGYTSIVVLSVNLLFIYSYFVHNQPILKSLKVSVLHFIRDRHFCFHEQLKKKRNFHWTPPRARARMCVMCISASVCVCVRARVSVQSIHMTKNSLHLKWMTPKDVWPEVAVRFYLFIGIPVKAVRFVCPMSSPCESTESERAEDTPPPIHPTRPQRQETSSAAMQSESCPKPSKQFWVS